MTIEMVQIEELNMTHKSHNTQNLGDGGMQEDDALAIFVGSRYLR